MNILLVCEVDWNRKVVFDMHLLAESLSLFGHYGIYVIDYQGANRDGSKRDEIVSRVFPESSVNLIHPYSIKVSGLSRMSAYLTHYYEIEKAIGENSIDAIILYSVPTNGFQTVSLAKKYKIPVIFRSIDVLNQLVPYPALRAITKRMERYVYSKVDRILTITPKLSDYVVGLGAMQNRVGILPMPVDTTLFCPANPDNELRRKWGITENDKVILFMGTLFEFSGLDTFIPKFKYMIAEEPNAKLLIVGDGLQRAKLEGIIRDWGLEGKVIITGFQPYRDVPKYINLADVCINTFIGNAITRDIFPGKTVQFLACGKPLVTRPLAGVKAVISGEEQGVVYAVTDYEMINEIESLFDIPARKNEVGQKGLRYVRENHSCDKVVKQLEGVLVECIKEKGKGK